MPISDIPIFSMLRTRMQWHQERQKILASAAQWLISSRRYDLAADLMEAAAAGSDNPAAVSNLSFLQPVKVGDVVCVYTVITRTGRSSITLGVEAWVLRRGQGERMRVTAAEFVLVAVDDAGRPRRLPDEV